jgi:uncharacterized protein (DUF2345 family)
MANRSNATINQTLNYLLAKINNLPPPPPTETLAQTLTAGNSAGTNDIDMNSNNITNIDTLSSQIGVAMNINGDDNLSLSAGGDLSLTGDANVYITASNDNIELTATNGTIQINSLNPTYFNFTTPNTADGVISVAEINRNNGDISIISQNNGVYIEGTTGLSLNANNGILILYSGDKISLDATTDLDMIAESEINLTSTTATINANSDILIKDATEPTWITTLQTGGLSFDIGGTYNVTIDAEGGGVINTTYDNGTNTLFSSLSPSILSLDDGTIVNTITPTGITTNDNFSITSTDNINLTSSANAINLNANLDITLTAVQGFLNITSTNDEISLTSSGATKITSNTGNIELIPINDGVTENGIVRINKNNSLLGDGFLTAGTIDISSDELGYNIAPQLTITNLNATAGITSGVPSVSFYKNGRIVGNNDRIGDFYFNANDTTNNKREWARMEVVTRNVSVGNEDGSISFFASLNGVSTEFMRINGADGDNNFLRPLDMNGSSILSTSGSLSISASASSGAGTITLTPKPLGNLVFANLPTSAVGLPTGAVWNNLGVLNIAP